jgi:signal transduction histidine kinase
LNIAEAWHRINASPGYSQANPSPWPKPSRRQQATVNDDSSPSAPHDRRRTDSPQLEELRREIALRDDVLSVAAHELRNPLHALAMHLALARTTAQAGNAAEAAERIRRAELTLKRYSERVTVLMELVATPSALYALQHRRIDVPALVAALVDSLAEEARLRGMTVRVACDESTFEPMRAVDPVAFEQVVDNLLLNAFKHSGASEVTIRLSTGAGSWSLQVEDNGHGIAPADQQTIFGKFAVATHSSRGAGTGLGLWIVSRLVQAMGGEVSVKSAPEQGCAFTVRIPERDDMSTTR